MHPFIKKGRDSIWHPEMKACFQDALAPGESYVLGEYLPVTIWGFRSDPCHL